MSHGKEFSKHDAKRIGDSIGINWDEYSLEEFRLGLAVELEHGAHDPETNVTDNDEIMTGKITWAHLKEMPDYYTRLIKMEAEAEAPKTEYKVSGKDVKEKLKEIIDEGNARRVIVKNNKDETIFEVPLTVGVIGVAIAPILAAAGAVAALVTDCTIVVLEKTKEE